jgi:drug/metabolite transporter (DMT)-like permease
MNNHQSIPDKSIENSSKGWKNGFIGVLIFSGSLPATRAAVLDLDPVFVTVSRATIAGLLALCVLLLFKKNDLRKNRFHPWSLSPLAW